MLDGFHRQIDIQVQPIEMLFIQKLDILDCGYRSVPEPREVVEREKVFSFAEEQPDSVLGNLVDFRM